MNGLPFYKAYPSDFIKGCIGMDLETKGAYRIVLDLIYAHGGGLDADDDGYIAGNLGCSVRKWRTIKNTLLHWHEKKGGTPKLVIQNGLISNFRADKELESARKYQLLQAEKGSKPKKNNKMENPRFNHTDTESDIRKKDNPPLVPPEGKPKKRKTTLDPSFPLTTERINYAADQGVRDIEGEFEQFKNNHIGKQTLWADWNRAWQTWCRNAVTKFAGNGNGARASPNEPFVSDETRAFQNLREKYRKEDENNSSKLL